MALLTSGLTIPPASTLNGTSSSADARLLPVAGARATVPVTYGQDRLAGMVLNVLPAAAGSSTLLVQVLWGFALHSVSDVKLNGQTLPTGSTVTHYLGTQSAADAALVTGFAAQGISYTTTLAGYAYSVVAMPTREFTGELAVTALVQGRKLYDPRKDSTAGGSGAHRLAVPSTWEYSDDPALALADFLSNTVYGAGEVVAWSTVATTANACSALVGTSPNTEKRRTLGLTMLKAAPLRDWAETLRAYAGCWLVPTGSGLALIPDADASTAATYTHASGQIEALEPLQLRDLGDSPTVVEVIYTDTSVVPWQDASATAQVSGAGSTKPWRVSTVRLPGVQRYSQARREAVERLNKLNLSTVTTQVQLFDEAAAHDRGDIIALTHPVGLSSSTFRVLGCERQDSGSWLLELAQHVPAVYSSTVESRTSLGLPGFVSTAGAPSIPTGLAVRQTVAGNVITWAANPEGDVLGYELRVGGTDWASATPLVGVTPTIVGGTSYTWAPPASATYNLRIVAFDAQGLQSAPAALNIYVARTEVRSELGLPLDLWQLNGQAIVTLTDGKVGSTALRLNSTAGAYPNQGNLVAIDAAKTYKVRFWARPSSACNGLLFFSLRQFLSQDIGGSTGPDNNGRDPYRPGSISKAAHDAEFGAGAWGEYTAEWTSADWQVGARYVVPEFLNNHTGTAGYWEVQDFHFYDASEVTAVAAAAANAASAAAAAQTSANAANTALASISSDSVLSKGEKPRVVQDWQAVSGEYAGILAQAAAYSITTEKDAYTTKFNALSTYLTGLSPAYSDTSQDTTIVAATFRAAWVEFYDARQVLLNKIADIAGQRATWASVSGTGKPADNATVGAPAGTYVGSVLAQDLVATANGAATAAAAAQDSATAANTALASISSDSVLSRGEKPRVVQDWQAVSGEYAGILAQATAYSITTEKDAYTTKFNALSTYLTGLSPAYSDTSQDTAIVAATFRAAWVALYEARQALLNKIAAIAGQRATWASVSGTGKPADNATVGAPAGTYVGSVLAQDLVATANGAATAAAAAQDSATAANTALASISSDSVLSRGEKPRVVQDWQAVSGEYAGILTQATAYSITTEKDAYTTKFNALSTYLSGLSPAYSDTSQDTAIVAATFRAAWVALYEARQALLNKIAAIAGQRATWASVSGTGKPADNATVGATFGVNVNGQASAVHIAENAATAVYSTTVAGPITSIDESHIPDGFAWQTEIVKINFPSGPAPDLGAVNVVVVVTASGGWEATGGSGGGIEVLGGLQSNTFDGSRIKSVASAAASETRRGQFTDQARFVVTANAANSFGFYAKKISVSGSGQSLSTLEMRVEVIKR